MSENQNQSMEFNPPEETALEKEAREAQLAVEKYGKELQNSLYIRLAEEAMEEGRPRSQMLEKEAREQLAVLQRAGQSLRQSYVDIVAIEDELHARLQDTKTSRDRKWYAPNPPANAAIDLKEERTGHFAQGTILYKILLICIVGSFAGVVVEMMWAFARYGLIESRRGLVYGPFNLLYGAGAVFLTLALYKYRNRGRIWSFAGGFLVGSALEYVCSWGQELLLGSRSWDYSAMPLNINGRICFTYSVFWGLLGIVWIKDLYPRMAKWILKIPNKVGKPVTWALTAFMVFNVIVSCVTVYRWSERLDGVPAASGFWETVDERFPNERMERIFANMTFG